MVKAKKTDLVGSRGGQMENRLMWPHPKVWWNCSRSCRALTSSGSLFYQIRASDDKVLALFEAKQMSFGPGITRRC